MLKKLFAKIRHALSSFWRWYKGLYRNAPWYKKLLVGFASFVIFVIVYLVSVQLNLFWLFGKSPSIRQIMHPETNEASLIYSADGVLIGKYFNENRSPVTYDEISPMFFKALIDTEDERFYSHHGIDFKGLFAALKDMAGGRGRGASTITQQLVKNMFRIRTQYSTGLLGKIPGLKIIIMKSKEWVLAVELEMFYEKNQILTMYANTVDFGSNAYGIKTAAKTYFNTTPKELKVEESAVLVGLLKATSTYNPRINPRNSLRRRNVVLANMVTHGDLSRSQYEELTQKPIELHFSVETAYDGQALYFRQAVAASLHDWCDEQGIDLYRDGLKIYTTLDTRMQQCAEQAVRKQMKVVQRNFNNHWGREDPWRDERHNVIPHFIEDLAQRTDTYKMLQAKYNGNPDSIDYYLNLPHEVKLFDYDGEKTQVMSTLDSIRYMVRFMHAGFVAMEPQTGYVKAWVGDIDFKTWKYDKVRAERQPGSTFKLFVYTEAMNQGLTPCDRYQDSYVSMDVYDKRKGQWEKWQPHNANGYFTGDSIPLISAFAQSINSIAVKVSQDVGIRNIIKTAEAMGIESPLDETPSLALGSSDVNLLEMVDAYSTIAADGVQREPVLVTRIEDRTGHVIYTAPTQTTQAVPYRTAFFMQQMLLGGLKQRGGTSMALWSFISPYASRTDFGGKTGTTNNHSDAWFIGVTPGLVGGAWVGGEYRSIHFRTGALGQGSRTALPIFGYFMQELLKNPEFQKKYCQKFPPAKEDIPRSLYMCDYAPRPRQQDTTAIDKDSISFELPANHELRTSEEEIIEELTNPDE